MIPAKFEDRRTVAVVYRPTPQYQLAEPRTGKYDCLAYATAVAIDRHTLGGVLVSGRDIRLSTNEPIPGTIGGMGLVLSQTIAAAYKLCRVRLTLQRSAAWSTVIGNLRSGRGVIACIVRGAFDDEPCSDPFDDEHGIYLNSLNTPGTHILTYDSLCRTARWVTIRSVQRATEAYGVRIGIGQRCRVALTRRTPNVVEA